MGRQPLAVVVICLRLHTSPTVHSIEHLHINIIGVDAIVRRSDDQNRISRDETHLY